MSEELRDSTVPGPVDGEQPRAHGPRPEHRRKLQRARWAVATIPPTRTRGVLVVEDDPDLQWRLARMLTLRGNRVVGTSSAEAALELMRQWPVDLVLVDDGLPGMSGMELARTIRDAHPETAVVLMTTEENQQARIAAKLAGAVAVVAKPFRVETLVELLRSFPKGEPELAPAE
ncbi:MAG TPA: response regulator [Sandaracinaceae bacterium LLY-WYZ-13_1]|nr:response regulator [Sandaracinaceae bacterium LLY-WYZ-13_1]